MSHHDHGHGHGHGHGHADAASLSVFEGIYQMVRPSPHSYIIMLSHASFLLCISAAVRRRLFLESAALALSCTISLLYHLCDENLYCAAGVDIYGWHAADVWSTFFLICFVMGVMVLDLQSAVAKALLRACYFAVVTLFVWLDPGNMLLLGSLLLSVAGSVIVRYSFFPPEPRAGEGAAGSGSSDDEGEDANNTSVSSVAKRSIGSASSAADEVTLLGIGGGSPNRAVVNRNRRPILRDSAATTTTVEVAASLFADVDTEAKAAKKKKNNTVKEVSLDKTNKKRRKSLQQRQRERYLAVALGIFTFALACFVVANTPVVGPETYSAARDGPKKPMDVPDTAVYWVFHSVWHFSSAIAGYYMVRFLTD